MSFLRHPVFLLSLLRKILKNFHFQTHTDVQFSQVLLNWWSVRVWVVVTCMSLPGWSCQVKESSSIGEYLCLALFLKLCRTIVFVFDFLTLQDTCVWGAQWHRNSLDEAISSLQTIAYCTGIIKKILVSRAEYPLIILTDKDSNEMQDYTHTWYLSRAPRAALV